MCITYLFTVSTSREVILAGDLAELLVRDVGHLAEFLIGDVGHDLANVAGEASGEGGGGVGQGAARRSDGRRVSMASFFDWRAPGPIQEGHEGKLCNDLTH